MSADYVRVRAYDMLVDARHQRAAVLPARSRTDADRGAGQPAATPAACPNRTGGPYNIPFTGFRDLQLQFNSGKTQYDALKLGVTRRASSRYEVRVQLHLQQGARRRRQFPAHRVVRARPDRPSTATAATSRVRARNDTPHNLTASGYIRVPWGINVGGILTSRVRLPLYRRRRNRRRWRRRQRRSVRRSPGGAHAQLVPATRA